MTKSKDKNYCEINLLSRNYLLLGDIVEADILRAYLIHHANSIAPIVI